MAMPITAGTNHDAIRSANAWIGAFEPWAFSMRRIICERVVSPPTRVAVNSKLPTLLIVAPTTVSPTFFSTGILSPVIIDSSIADEPLVISPSTGTFSPGRTKIVSPLTTCSIGISSVWPSRMTRAVFAWSPMSFLIASDVLFFALASSHLPRITKVIRNAAVSKYSSGIFTPFRPMRD